MIGVDAGASDRFADLSASYPALTCFDWNPNKSNNENFEALVQIAIEQNRNRLLVAGCSTDQSCLVIALLALGRGFDVYLCGDLIDGPKTEAAFLRDRLRQQGAIIVSKNQILAEYSAVSMLA